MNIQFEKNHILVGSYKNSLDNIPFHDEPLPSLIILDLSLVFFQKRTRISVKNQRVGSENLKSLMKFYNEKESTTYFENLKILFSKILVVLNTKGFFAIQVNGTIKHVVKVIIDEVFGIDNFVNEIIINSPLNITYTVPNGVIEQTEYILLYSKTKNPRLKPVFNNKRSGGYWHSFISKGQGTAKNFLINGQIIRLQPPVGTHWKLKQESILKLCGEGKIRLNKNGNPEYWVPEKIGQIIDSNWLDIYPLQKDENNDSFYSEIYERLFNSLITPDEIVLLINSYKLLGLVKATQLDLKWIYLISNDEKIKNIATSLDRYNIKYSISHIKESGEETVISQDEKVTRPTIEKNEDYTSSNVDLIHKSTYLETKKGLNWSNDLIQGDCIHVLRLLQSRYHKSLKLIYIDPPFYTGLDEVINIPVFSTNDTNGSSKSSRSIDHVAYENVLNGEKAIEEFKFWFKERLALMRPLLRLDGFIFVRFDYHFGHYARAVLDEIFEVDNFVIEFLIRRMKKNLSQKQLNRQTHLIVHNDSLFVYRASEQAILNMSKVNKKIRKYQDFAERENSNDNIWLDIAGYQKTKKTLYPTENAETLLRRVIEVSTSQKDIIADFYAGSGTSLAVAETLGRKWIGVDIGNHSINEIRKRLLQFPDRTRIDYFKIKSLISDQKLEKKSTIANLAKIDIVKGKQGRKVTVVLRDSVEKIEISELKAIDSYVDLIDYWEIDWNFNGLTAIISWYSMRLIEKKVVLSSVDSYNTHNYSSSGSYSIFVNIVDIFGNSAQRVFKIQI
ncbi:MAG: DNA methyltransferase [Candidatus Hodarchaeales archaeon]|jgi:adenine specific DNA methylase Mod